MDIYSKAEQLTAAMNAAGNRRETMKMYHGTTREGLEGMKADGFVNGPVYLTARRDVAEDYSGGVVLQFDVDTSTLEMDTEGRDFDGEDINEWIRSGGSVYVSAALPFASACVFVSE